jgi:hypothetical protein
MDAYRRIYDSRSQQLKKVHRQQREQAFLTLTTISYISSVSCLSIVSEHPSSSKNPHFVDARPRGPTASHHAAHATTQAKSAPSTRTLGAPSRRAAPVVEVDGPAADADALPVPLGAALEDAAGATASSEGHSGATSAPP